MILTIFLVVRLIHFPCKDINVNSDIRDLVVEIDWYTFPAKCDHQFVRKSPILRGHLSICPDRYMSR